jgi:hypothetical protein
METVTLRTLLRNPAQVKNWTRRGTKVQVTDRGEPLWVIQAAEENENAETRSSEMEDMFKEVLAEPISPVSLSQLIKDARR